MADQVNNSVTSTKAHKAILAVPRLSEKTSRESAMRKFTFTVYGKKSNKLEVKAFLEKNFGIKIAAINSLNVSGKYKRTRNTYGKTSDYRKFVVTLTKDSKLPELAEVA